MLSQQTYKIIKRTTECSTNNEKTKVLKTKQQQTTKQTTLSTNKKKTTVFIKQQQQTKKNTTVLKQNRNKQFSQQKDKSSHKIIRNTSSYKQTHTKTQQNKVLNK